jgi:hypothetical protein
MTTRIRCPNPKCQREFDIDLTGKEGITRGKYCDFCQKMVMFQEINGKAVVIDFIAKI